MDAKMAKLLNWMDGKYILESQIVASGLSGTLDNALLSGWADLADPNVRERSGIPAAAFTTTDAGLKALGAKRKKNEARTAGV